jgi:hypothetical protein
MFKNSSSGVLALPLILNAVALSPSLKAVPHCEPGYVGYTCDSWTNGYGAYGCWDGESSAGPQSGGFNFQAHVGWGCLS